MPEKLELSDVVKISEKIDNWEKPRRILSKTYTGTRIFYPDQNTTAGYLVEVRISDVGAIKKTYVLNVTSDKKTLASIDIRNPGSYFCKDNLEKIFEMAKESYEKKLHEKSQAVISGADKSTIIAAIYRSFEDKNFTEETG